MGLPHFAFSHRKRGKALENFSSGEFTMRILLLRIHHRHRGSVLLYYKIGAKHQQRRIAGSTILSVAPCISNMVKCIKNYAVCDNCFASEREATPCTYPANITKEDHQQSLHQQTQTSVGSVGYVTSFE
ncbi:hypothetical protein DAPPUDRAFT_100344 [Daphnia pulex]|uniref:Uncharacterized protein n=1 Tax=Daphnia pulex TaxID=6669 RepID=E9GA45_DAPPU|nr:hypothetical protein DAPPUDRAFT_100344 [Daphnia pulex]|eukprot:EFX83677.1 hypothetical protein DAPPUDRAFT_100344 [Daphnia pulex]